MGSPFTPPPAPDATNVATVNVDELLARIAALESAPAASPASPDDALLARLAKLEESQPKRHVPDGTNPLALGSRVKFASAAGVQHGEVVELSTAQLAPTVDDPHGPVVHAASVAWLTGGESGPIPVEQLEAR